MTKIDPPIIFIVGLTGVGKSTTLEALKTTSDFPFHLLPNRRELTDQIIIPHVQKLQGIEIKPVKDREERFALTAEYRKKFPQGMAHVAKTYIDGQTQGAATTLVFDNLRGKNEVEGAIELFHNLRFIVLDASEEVRLTRMVGRLDQFDQMDGSERERLEKAKKIIATEKENYDMTTTVAYLQNQCTAKQLCYIHNDEMTKEDVIAAIQRWL